MNGNFQSYTSFVAPAEPTGQPFAQVRVHDAVNKVSSVDGAITETTQSNARGNAAELNPYHGTDSIFATARNPSGSPVTEIAPETLVMIAGVQAPVSFWVSEGMLQKAADGTYVQASGNAPAAPQADTSSTALDVMPISEQGMASINAAIAEVPQGNLDSLMATATGVAIGKITAASMVQRFAQISGLGIDESQARVTTIMAAYQGQAEQALTTRAGVAKADLPEFFAWARANRQGQLQDTVQRQMHAHDVSGFKALASEWMASTPPSLNALKAAGLSVRQQGTGSEVFVRGSWMVSG